MDDKFLQPYNPQDTEDGIYSMWEKSGFFNPDTCVEKGVCEKDAEPFTIVLPPPNVTGTLHIGNSLMLVVEDILIRYNRMHGKKTLWIPGTDHASIATAMISTAPTRKWIRLERLNDGSLNSFFGNSGSCDRLFIQISRIASPIVSTNEIAISVSG